MCYAKDRIKCVILVQLKILQHPFHKTSNVLRCCCCFCSPCSTKVSVSEYYAEKVHQLEIEVLKQQEMSLHAPLGRPSCPFMPL